MRNLWIIGLIALNCSCNLSKGLSSSSSGSEVGAAAAPTDLFSASLITGSWKSACYTITGNPGASTFKEVMIFSGSSLIVQDLLYSDGACTVPYAEQIWQGAFTVGSYTGSTPYAARSLDMVQTALLYTPASAAAASDANTASMCGITNWTNAGARSIAGLNCNGNTTPGNGSTLFNIVAMNASRNRVYLGTSNATSAAGRATAEDTDFYYIPF